MSHYLVHRYNALSRTHAIVAFVGVASLVVGGIAGAFLFSGDHACTGYVYVNEDVICGKADIIRKTGYIETQRSLAEYVELSKKEVGIAHVSVYFRDLKRGPTFGINELTAFAPASLLKLPLAFVFLSAAESQPEVLVHKVQYDGTTTVSAQRVSPSASAERGKEYTITELLRLMITYSDNAAYEVLESFLNKSDDRMTLRLEAFQELGLIDPRDRVEATITVRGYASLFRILYNASYLSADNSEMLLTWLAETEYDAGLAAGVPEDVRVAHKFGERLFEDGTKELHDCGIIYFPENPYLLCVMTRGNDWGALEEFISTVSRTVYTEVNSRRL